MALTPVVVKTSVTEVMSKMWSVSMTLTITDDSGPGFSRQFSQNYKEGNDLVDLYFAFLADMRDAIDKYETEQALYNSVQFDNLVTALQNAMQSDLEE